MSTRLLSFVVGAGCIVLMAGCLMQPGSTPPATGKTAGAGEWDDHTQGLPFVMGYEAGLAQAKSEGKPAMLFVTTTWCGWCKKLAEESFNNPEVRKLLEDNFVLVIVDGDTEPGPTRKLGVDGFPHLIFLDQAGNRVEECPGYKPVGEFKGIVQSALSKSKSA